MKEIKREKDVIVKDQPFVTRCIRCGNTLKLSFNGGELDIKFCCGLTYELDAPQIDFVISGYQ